MARVSNINNYYPFGIVQLGRMYSTGDSKCEKKCKEEDDEVS